MPQEDEITLLDEGDARAVVRPPRPITLADLGTPPNWRASEDDLEELSDIPAPVVMQPILVDGIEEISMTAAAVARPARKRASVKPAAAITEVERPARYNGLQVYAQDRHLYTFSNASVNTIAYSSYSYINPEQAHTPAVSMMMGSTPVFCSNKADLAKFKELLQRVDITVAGGKTLCFFTGTEFGSEGSDLVVICFDGQTIRYGAGRNDERIMKLDNPICQKPSQIFTALTSFAIKSTQGAEKDIKTQKDLLQRLASVGSEEAYLYIQEIEPPAERAAVHARILGELETRYASDQRSIALARNALAEAAQKIEIAKSQIPSGRKGVPLRNSYLSSPVLARMLDYFKIIKDGRMLKAIFTYKNDLVLENIEYGRPEVTVNMYCGEGNRRGGTFIQESRGVTVRSADKNAFLHPHIETDVRWCLGTYITPINNAIMGGNIPVAASLIWEYLSRYNPDSPLINIETCRSSMASARPRDLIIRRK